MSRPLPTPLYSCHHKACAEDVSWPAEDLHWSEAHQGWICSECWSGVFHGENVISLADELKARSQDQDEETARARRELQNIAQASPEKWDLSPEEFNTEFRFWAQNRARALFPVG